MILIRKISNILLALVLCTLIVILAGPARSSTGSRIPVSVLESLPQTTDNETSFYKALVSGKSKEALLMWSAAHRNSKFGKSDSGKALYAYLLFTSGLETQGLDKLTEISPTKISAPMLELWQGTAHRNHFVWRSYDISGKYAQSWQNHFDDPRKSRPIHPITNNRSLTRLRNQAMSAKDPATKDWLLWQTAIGASILDRHDIALNAYAQLLTNSSGAVPVDNILMAQARTLYQMERFDDAITTYDRIPKSSDFWLEALEEKAWANVRLERYDQALAPLKTLLSPVFTPQVGPEPHFMRALVGVQRCDFPLVYDSFEEFRKTQKLRISSLQKLKSKEITPEIRDGLNKVVASGLDWKALGPKIQMFPHLFYRDEMFTRSVAELAQATKEQVAAAELIELANRRKLNAGSLTQMLSENKTKADQLKDKSLPKILDRLADLAEADLKNISSLLRRMHVLEAESIQRMYLFANNGKTKIPKIERGKDTLVFPDNNEVWIDALTDYKVRSVGCPDSNVLANK